MESRWDSGTICAEHDIGTGHMGPSFIPTICFGARRKRIRASARNHVERQRRGIFVDRAAGNIFKLRQERHSRLMPLLTELLENLTSQSYNDVAPTALSATCPLRSSCPGPAPLADAPARGESRRDSITQPGVARHELPWGTVRFQPQRGCGHSVSDSPAHDLGHNRVAVESISES